MKKQIHIRDHLILPFGTARRFDLNRIKLSSVAANGIYFTSDIPCIYINKSAKKPLTLRNFEILTNSFPDDLNDKSGYENVSRCIDLICNSVRKCMPNPTHFELLFVEHYFGYLKDVVLGPPQILHPLVIYNALLPIPEMQLYVEDPLEDQWTYEPTNNFRVDFGFWDGVRLTAVEIDGNEPSGYARDIRRDRLLRRAQVDVVHILNTEIAQHGRKIIGRLLPRSITIGWRAVPPAEYPFLPF